MESTNRFTDNHNGTVTDNLTGLIWLQNANCFGQRTWTQALNVCDCMRHLSTLADGSCRPTDDSTAGNWYLPNREELLSLVDCKQYDPALPTNHPFSIVQSGYYWSSTTFAGTTDYAWVVSLNTGLVSYAHKDHGRYVWYVRGNYNRTQIIEGLGIHNSELTALIDSEIDKALVSTDLTRNIIKGIKSIIMGYVRSCLDKPEAETIIRDTILEMIRKRLERERRAYDDADDARSKT